MRIDDIVIGRRRRRSALFAELTPLTKALRGEGQRWPIIVGPEHQLIDGWRRLEAARLMGRTDVNAVTAATLGEAAKLISAQPQGLEMTPSEKAFLGFALESLPREKGTNSDHRDTVGRVLGLSAGSWQRLRCVALPTFRKGTPEEERELATQLLEQIDRGEVKITTAWGLIREQRVADGRAANSTGTAITGEVSQRRALQGAASALSGVLYGLEQLREFEIDPEELAAFLLELSGYRTRLAGFIRRAGKQVSS